MALSQIVTKTDIGMHRDHNEDDFIVIESVGLLAVADGMGGLEKGEIASATAVKTLSTAEKPLQQLSKTAKLSEGAEGRIQIARTLDVLAHMASEKIQEVTGGVQSGTTLVVGMVTQNHLVISHVGDSRAYLCRAGRLRCLTQDHTVAASQLRAGMITQAEHDASPYQHMLYQALGTAGDVDPDLLDIPLAKDDLLLFCSDGLTGPISEDELELLLASADEDLEKTASKLIEAANLGGGPDNITVVLARNDSGPDAEEVDDLAGALLTCPLFAEMDEDLYGFLGLYLDQMVVEEGTVFDLKRGLHILLRGSAAGNGTDLESGTAFGFRGILNMPGTGLEVTATSTCHCAILSTTALEALQERRPSLAVPLLKGILRAMAERHEGP
jgi:serine/threonine protein phosphatase PrpC